MLLLLMSLVLLSSFFVFSSFISYLYNFVIGTQKHIFIVVEIWTIVVLPLLFLFQSDIGRLNDCCADSALFSPEHRIGIYILILVCTIAYLTSIFKKNLLPPLVELLINAFLILGLIINVTLFIHLSKIELGVVFSVFGILPIIFLFYIKLNENQKLLKQEIDKNEIDSNTFFGKICIKILKLSPIYKYPILTLILVPIIVSLSLFLVLFGQKPDSIIKAFTDTYRHGFSQLDYMCDNVECGGHFLCSVGANGHNNIVKPIRYGERNGHKIICNRQLLVSNAFEELIHEKLPRTHKIIRQNYNKIGKIIHKHYHIFNNKYVSDFVYIFMKPLEFCFLLTLYTFDKKPENRIAKQYVSQKIRQKIAN